MSTDNTESQLDRQLLYEGKIIKVFKDTVLLSDNKRTTREIVEHASVVCVMALDEDGYIHMVKQYRYAISSELMEIPAGGIEQGNWEISRTINSIGWILAHSWLV